MFSLQERRGWRRYVDNIINHYLLSDNVEHYHRTVMSDSSVVSTETSNSSVREVVIIGSGPSGCTAAIYTARALLRPLLLAGYTSGGQLMLTSDVENFPGYRTPVTGK